MTPLRSHSQLEAKQSQNENNFSFQHRYFFFKGHIIWDPEEAPFELRFPSLGEYVGWSQVSLPLVMVVTKK